MRLRRAVLQIPPKPLVPLGLPLYKSRDSLTRAESTLLQVLNLLDFISRRINTYIKPGGGTPLFQPQRFSTRHPFYFSQICHSERSEESEESAVSSFRRLVFASLPRYVFTSHSQGSAPTQQRPQPQSPLRFTSQLSVYPGGVAPSSRFHSKCDA